MAMGQTTGEAKAGRLGKTGNEPYRHFFPAPLGSRCGGRPASNGHGQSHPGFDHDRSRWIVSPQRDADNGRGRN